MTNEGGTVRYHRADYRPGTDEPWLVWFTKDQADPYWFTAGQGEAMGLTPPEPLVVTCNGHSIELSDEEAEYVGKWWDIRRRTETPFGDCAVRFSCGCILRDNTTPVSGWSLCMYHQGYDAGFRVVPIPDDNTRALAARLRNAATVACEAWGESAEADVPVVEVGGYAATHTLGTHDLLAAAALLDGQPEDRPDRCPTCGSDDPGYRVDVDDGSYYAPVAIPCPDPWHVGGSGDTR